MAFDAVTLIWNTRNAWTLKGGPALRCGLTGEAKQRVELKWNQFDHPCFLPRQVEILMVL